MNHSKLLLALLFSGLLLSQLTWAEAQQQQQISKGQYFEDALELLAMDNQILILKEFSDFHFKKHPANAFIPNDSAWSASLETKIKEGFPVYQVISKEIQETASSEALERSRKLLKRYTPELVILALGENDGLYSRDVKEIKMYLGAIIDMAKKSDAKVILLANQLPAHYGAKYTKDFKNMYQSLAKEYEVAFIDQKMMTGNQIFMPGNYTHEKLWPTIEKILAKQV